jgi:hypothetical protein
VTSEIVKMKTKTTLLNKGSFLSVKCEHRFAGARGASCSVEVSRGRSLLPVVVGTRTETVRAANDDIPVNRVRLVYTPIDSNDYSPSVLLAARDCRGIS